MYLWGAFSADKNLRRCISQPWAGAASRPNLHKKDKRAALVPTPITPHWKHPLLVSTALFFLEPCRCASSSWFEQRARILSVIAPRYEEAACIKAAMTPFWSGHSTHPHLQLFARVGASPLPIVFLCNMLMARMRMILIRMIGVAIMVMRRCL